MTSAQAKEILLLHRPDSPVDDPQMAEALRQVERDPELAAWFERHKAFQSSVSKQFQKIAPPALLKDRILAEQKIIRPVWLQRWAWLAAAAAIIVLGIVWGKVFHGGEPDRFTDYRNRMISSALRQYRMDIKTNDLQSVTQYLAQHGAPADYQLTSGLKQLTVAGGGKLQWRGTPVSMVCFKKANEQMLFLFVVHTTALKGAPSGSNPEVQQVNKLMTASWTQNGRTYLLAGEENSEEIKKFF
ncbi:MAG TPA: hypothetical protein VGE41_13545 [Verrucomicrobiae bacterium]|jgi:hypothetical protein